MINNNLLRIVMIYLVGIALQALHLLEEFLSGFHNPLIFGAQPWSDGFFVSLNLAILCIFILATAGILWGRIQFICFNIIWIFSIISILNGIVHPVLSFFNGSYFPGTITVPAHFLIGIWLIRLLVIWKQQQQKLKNSSHTV